MSDRICVVSENRVFRFFKSFASVLVHCVGEDGEVLAPAILVLACLGVFCLFGIMVHDLILDPNSIDVASRLNSLSIDPDKWKLLS